MPKLSSLGAILSAFGFSMTWICCLPVALGAAGAALASVGTFLGPFQPYLAGLSLVLLAVAIGQSVRQSRRACDDGSCPADLGRKRMLLVLLTALVLLLVTIPWWSSWVIYWLL